MYKYAERKNFIVTGYHRLLAAGKAIYQIVTCRSTYTSHDDGVHWSASKTCYVSGYPGRGYWNIPNDREKPLYIEDPSHHILVDRSGAHSTSKEVAVN